MPCPLFGSSRSMTQAIFWSILAAVSLASSVLAPAAQAAAIGGGSVVTTPITGSTIPMGLALNTPGAGEGQTYYVATTGSDSNNGLSPQTPFLTIQHAIETVGPGGTIEIMGGTYAGGITIDHPGTANGWNHRNMFMVCYLYANIHMISSLKLYRQT